MVRFDTIQRRRYTCGVCGAVRVLETKPIEKWVLVCIHEDSRGTELPQMQLREEGRLVVD